MTAGKGAYVVRVVRGVADVNHRALVRDVLLGVSVVIERDRDGIHHARTDCDGQIRSWSASSMAETELYRLARAALALRGGA